jgi:hypothetical protein
MPSAPLPPETALSLPSVPGDAARNTPACCFAAAIGFAGGNHWACSRAATPLALAADAAAATMPVAADDWSAFTILLRPFKT